MLVNSQTQTFYTQFISFQGIKIKAAHTHSLIMTSNGISNVEAYHITETIDIKDDARVDIKFQLPLMPQLQHASAERKIRRAFYECIKVLFLLFNCHCFYISKIHRHSHTHYNNTNNFNFN